MLELEKVLEEIEQEVKEYMEIDFGDEYNAGAKDMAKMARKIIRKHMNDGWIPVDERLPEELAPVLVTACVPVRKPGWDKRKECCVVVDTDVYDPEIKHGWEHFKDKVTAWMPLPEPYQREEAINEKE